MTVAFKRIHPAAALPAYAHPGDAGLDLCACEPERLLPGERKRVATGLIMELTVGFEGQIRPRSGLALRHGITVLNSPGTIDAGYRGEIGVMLINLGSEPFDVRPGMRIAQLVIAPVTRMEVIEVEALAETARGGNGFGSTGS